MKRPPERTTLERLDDFIEYADAVNKKADVSFYCTVRDHIIELETAMANAWELAEEWTCVVQKPTPKEEVVDQCAIKLRIALGDTDDW